jgi:hypothetical protein
MGQPTLAKKVDAMIVQRVSASKGFPETGLPLLEIPGNSKHERAGAVRHHPSFPFLGVSKPTLYYCPGGKLSK